MSVTLMYIEMSNVTSQGSIVTNALKLVFSIFASVWDRVGSDFRGLVPGYSLRWAIIGDSTKISVFTNLNVTQNMGSNHLLCFFSANFFIYQMTN